MTYRTVNIETGVIAFDSDTPEGTDIYTRPVSSFSLLYGENSTTFCQGSEPSKGKNIFDPNPLFEPAVSNVILSTDPDGTKLTRFQAVTGLQFFTFAFRDGLGTGETIHFICAPQDIIDAEALASPAPEVPTPENTFLQANGVWNPGEGHPQPVILKIYDYDKYYQSYIDAGYKTAAFVNDSLRTIDVDWESSTKAITFYFVFNPTLWDEDTLNFSGDDPSAWLTVFCDSTP